MAELQTTASADRVDKLLPVQTHVQVQARLQVLVVWSGGPRHTQEQSVNLPLGASVADAVQASGAPDQTLQTLGIWGRKVGPAQLLQEYDRVDIYRALKVDPKLARRERFNQQGQGKSGLFAHKRKGAAAGY